MTNCESGVHDRPTRFTRKPRARSQSPLSSPSPQSIPLQQQPAQTWKIEEKYGLDLGLLDRVDNQPMDCPESLLGRLKIASLSQRPCRGTGESEDS